MLKLAILLSFPACFALGWVIRRVRDKCREHRNHSALNDSDWWAANPINDDDLNQ